MKTGSVVIRPSKRLKFTPSVAPATTSSGAVSPMTREMASTTPVMTPPIAVGTTTLRMVRHLGTPSAYAASRRSIGTNRNISSDDRTTVGIISRDRAIDPPSPIR